MAEGRGIMDERRSGTYGQFILQWSDLGYCREPRHGAIRDDSLGGARARLPHPPLRYRLTDRRGKRHDGFHVDGSCQYRAAFDRRHCPYDVGSTLRCGLRATGTAIWITRCNRAYRWGCLRIDRHGDHDVHNTSNRWRRRHATNGRILVRCRARYLRRGSWIVAAIAARRIRSRSTDAGTRNAVNMLAYAGRESHPYAKCTPIPEERSSLLRVQSHHLTQAINNHSRPALGRLWVYYLANENEPSRPIVQ